MPVPKSLLSIKKTGLLIKQKNVAAIKKALLWATAHPKARTNMAQALNQRIKNDFDWTTITANFNQLFSQTKGQISIKQD